MTISPPEHLVEALKDAHAMEVNVFDTLESMISTGW